MISDVMIRSFLTLAKTLNFTNAAKELFLSQQAVSKHISRLEEALDCQLLNRERGNIRLTKAGEIYLEIFSKYEAAMEEAKTMIRRMQMGEEKRISVGYLDLLDISGLFYPLLMTFKADHPDVSFEYHSSPDWELPTLLKDDKVDLTITFDSEITPNDAVECFPIARAQERLFVSKDHPLAKPDASYKDFKNENIFCSLPPTGNIDKILKRLDSYGFPYENLIISENMLSSCTSIEMGQGVSFAVMPCKLIDPKIFATYPTGKVVNIVMCYRKSSTNPMLLSFIDRTKSYIAEHPEMLEIK